MTVQIPEDRISSLVQSRLSTFSKTAKVDGFRPGKVPMKVIQRRFGATARQEAVAEIMQDSFTEALSSEQLRPAGRPVIEPLDHEDGKGFSYKAVFEVYPEVEVQIPETLTIEKPVCELTDTHIDQTIEDLRRQHKGWRTADRASQAGDQLTIDFVGMIDGEPFDDGTADGFQLVLGENQLISGFEDGLMGVSVDQQVVLDLTFPEKYAKQELAGKPVQFNVTVTDVSEPKLPDLDDDLFSMFGVKEGGIEAFRQEVKESLTHEKDQMVQNIVRTRLFNALRDANIIELPKSLVAEEAEKLCKSAQGELDHSHHAGHSHHHDGDQNLHITPDQYEEQAKKRIQLGLVMAEIIENQSLKADTAKVREAVVRIANNYQEPDAIVKWYYDDKHRLSKIESSVLEEEVTNWLMSQVNVQEVTLSFDELKNSGQTDTETENGKNEHA